MNLTDKTKVCHCCGQELPAEYFNKNARNKDGLQHYCKDCQKAKIKESRERRRRKSVTFEPQSEALDNDTQDLRELTWDKKAEAREHLEHLPDSEILVELRRRGYIGKIYKKIEVIL